MTLPTALAEWAERWNLIPLTPLEQWLYENNVPVFAAWCKAPHLWLDEYLRDEHPDVWAAWCELRGDVRAVVAGEGDE